MCEKFDWYLMDYIGDENITSPIPEYDMTNEEREALEEEDYKGECQWCGQPCGEHTICIDCADQYDAYWGYSRTAS